jgi:LmbE family N-acetylglucosaminyl deacetylase
VEDLKSHQLVGMIDGLVRELKPAAMFSHCLANLHTDHKLAYEACMASQRLRYFDIFCYSPTSCHCREHRLSIRTPTSTSRTRSRLRCDAIRSHSSQFDDVAG